MKIIPISLFILLSFCAVNAQDNRAAILQDLEKSQFTAPQDTQLTATLKSASRLFGAKDDLTTVILIIPADSIVEVLGSDSTYFNVVYEDYEGYIYKRDAKINEVLALPKPLIRSAETTNEEKLSAPPQQTSRFSYLENKYGSSMAAKLMSGKVWKGMDAEMVRDSWGKPQKINRVIARNIVKEEWIYKSTWLYIENDILVEWGAIR